MVFGSAGAVPPGWAWPQAALRLFERLEVRRRAGLIGTTTDREPVDRRAAFFLTPRLARALVLRLAAVAVRLAVRRAALFLVFLRAVAFFFRDPAVLFLALRLATFFLAVFLVAAAALFFVRRAAGFFFLPAFAAVVRRLAVFLLAFFLVALRALVPAFLRVLRRAAVAAFFLAARFLVAVAIDGFEREVRAFLRLAVAKVTSPYELH